MEEIIFGLVAGSGDARSDLMQAIKLARTGAIDEAEALLISGEDKLLATHKVQTTLIQKEARGDTAPFSLLLCHAQDHLMTTMLLNDLAKELVATSKRLCELEARQ